MISSFAKWDFKKVFLTIVFSTATFAASFVLGNAITAALGPGMSGLATIIITTILVVICAKLVEARGVFTIMVTFFTLLAIPTTMFGPPHPLKIVIGVITGLVYDLTWFILGKIMRLNKIALPVAAALSTMVSIISIYFLMKYLIYPKVEYLRSVLYYIIPVYGILGFIGGAIGESIYNKSLSNMSLIKQLKA